MPLENKVALVTGAGRGMGRAMAMALAGERSSELPSMALKK